MIGTMNAPLSAAPSAAALLGTFKTTEVMDQVMQAWGNGDQAGVLFGMRGDPYAERYKNFMNVVINNISESNAVALSIANSTVQDETYIPITTMDDLAYPTPTMQIVISQYEPIRQLILDEKIDGYPTVCKEFLEEQDDNPYERLAVTNGLAVFDKRDRRFNPDVIVWEWRSSDPDLTDDNCIAIRKTYDFIDSWLERELGPGGERRDPTDPYYSNIGK